MIVVEALRVVPVKGLAAVLKDRVRVERYGVPEDRRVFLLDDAGRVVTLRRHPELVRVRPDLDLERGLLAVTLPDGTSARSALDDVAEAVGSRLFGKDRYGRVLGGDVAEALSSVAREPLRVVLADGGAGWDEGPVSMIGRTSAAAVGGRDADLARYRMLMDVAGTEPYEEDTWVGRQIEVGDVRLFVTHALDRCIVINASPATGRQDWDGLRALADARGRGELRLGVIADVVVPGDVAVGSVVRVLPGGPRDRARSF